MIFRIGLPRSEELYDLDSDGEHWDDIARDLDKKKKDACSCICVSYLNFHVANLIISVVL